MPGPISASRTVGAMNQPPQAAAAAIASTQKIIERSSSRCSTKLMTRKSPADERAGGGGAFGDVGRPVGGASGLIALLLQDAPQLVHELVEVAEAAVDGCEAHVGDFVERLQAVHHRFADVARRDLGAGIVEDSALDLVDQLFELRARDRPLLAGLDEAG